MLNSHAKHVTQRGQTLVYLLVIIFLFTLMMLPLINSLLIRNKVIASAVDKEKALEIAEAGINYYQWHLAHYPNDFKDGATSTGPYIHTYTDTDAQTVLGTYSLTITPPPIGSTLVTIKSVGVPTSNPNIQKTITAQYGIPSLAQYSFLSNDVIWIGNNEKVFGQLQSNNGVRFDGTTNATVSSAKSTYTCPSTQGSPCPTTKPGVWGNATQASKNFWQYPVPTVDFSSLTSNLATLKSTAQSTTTGIYLPPSNAQGYSLVFKSNGTVDIYKVTSLSSNPTGWDVNNSPHNEYIDYSGRTLLYNKVLPTNGVIYVEDKIWVEGTVNGRVMVAAATLPYNPSTAPSIYIPNNILYAAKDGTSVLGLLSQDDIVVTHDAPNNIEIDAALIAQNGSAQFYYYPGVVKGTITVYGSIMTYGQWTWTWVDGSGNVTAGYATTVDNYDGHLLYAPPPSFPISSNGYQLMNWISN